MDIIVNNPYRVAGILSNTTARELQKQKAKITAYSKVDKEISSEYDFNFIKNITRTQKSINRAFSGIQQNPDKVSNSLFWFLNASPFDNTAIEYLKKGNPEKAAEIWRKVTQNKDVSSKNFSAFNNLGTYKLLSQSEDDIQAGIEAKIKLIESDFFENFVHSVADETFTINRQRQLEKLVDELLAQFKNQYSSSETLALFSNCNGTTQKYLSKKFTEEPIHNIESRIENTKDKRKGNQSDAYNFGVRLANKTKEELNFLKSLLGKNNLKYKMIADNLAKEIMQCGIDYFKTMKETQDPSSEGLRLLKYAKTIAVGNQTKDRVKENIDGIREWAETAPVKEEFDFIMKKLITTRSLTDSVDNAKDLVISCRPKLHFMKSILGNNNEKYLDLSTAVASSALGMLVSVINEKQNDDLIELGQFINLRSALREALSVSKEIEKMDMKNEQRDHFNTNYKTLVSIASQLSVSTFSSSSSSSNRQSSSSATRTTTPERSYKTESSDDGITILGKIVLGIGLFMVVLGIAGYNWAWLIAGFIGFGYINSLIKKSLVHDKNIIR